MKVIVVLIIIQMVVSCGQKAADPSTDEPAVKSRTPVTVTTMLYEPMEEDIVLNATSTFLQRSYVKANLNGYIKSVSIHFGSFVNNGQVLFSLKTKESEALGNTINKLDSNFKFSG